MKIELHTVVSVSKEASKDVSGYSAKDTIPQLERLLDDFARNELQNFQLETGQRGMIHRRWITISPF